MEIHRDIDKLPVFKNAIVTTGAFDGVHRGHQQLIERIKQLAKDLGGESVLITFDPHPRLVLKPGDNSLQLLTTLDEKIELLKASGINHFVVAPFTTAFSKLPARDYVSDFLVAKFHPKVIALGYNHNFGYHADGHIELLQKMAAQYNYEVEEISKQIVDEIDVSSTRIREALAEGDLVLATHLLGHYYSFEGTIVQGRQLGRQIGFPTANIDITDPHKLVPAFGVYAVMATINGTQHKGVMNIGNRPTIDGKSRTIEVHLIDFNADIYGEYIKVECLYYLRPEIKFDGLDALKAQIAKDKEKAIQLLG